MGSFHLAAVKKEMLHDVGKQRQFFDWIAEQLNVHSTDHWYMVSKFNIRSIGGKPLLVHVYKDSLVDALERVYTDTEWQPWRFEYSCAGFGREVSHYRRYFDWLAGHLSILRPQHWYGVSNVQIKDNYGGPLLQNYFSNSLLKALQITYPEEEWQPWRFVDAPKDIWEDLATHKQFLDWVAHELHIHHHDDWYPVKVTQVEQRGGKFLLEKYSHSLWKALERVYTEVSWQPWRFEEFCGEWWKDSKLQRMYFEYIGHRLGVKKPEDWYWVTNKEVEDQNGGLLLRNYSNFLCNALQKVYPNVAWQPWKFADVPEGYFDLLEHQQLFLEWAAGQLGVLSLDDWYDIVPEEIAECGGSSLLRYYQGSLHQALQSVYSHKEWQPTRFAVTPRGYWESIRHRRHFPSVLPEFWNQEENQLKYFDWLAFHLQLKEVEDWYHIGMHEVLKHGDGGLLALKYNNSLQDALQSVFPTVTWIPWKFIHLPENFWNNFKRHKEYFNWLGRELDIVDTQQWYKVTTQMVIKNHGGKLLCNHYNNNLARALQSVYPEVIWHPWKFIPLADGLWNDSEIRRRFFDWLGIQLGVSSREDWYKVTKADVAFHGGGAMLANYYENSLAKAMQDIFSEYEWHPWRFAGSADGLWHTHDCQLQFFEFLGKKLKIQTYDDWYQTSTVSVLRNHGAPLLKIYGSIGNSLAAVYPHFDWKPWRFKQISNDYWGDIRHHYQFFEWFRDYMGIQKSSDWYKVTRENLEGCGGMSLLNHSYHGSFLAALDTWYPQETLHFDNDAHYMNWLAIYLGIQKTDDWYSVDLHSVFENDGRISLEKYENRPYLALDATFQNIEWQPWRFQSVHLVAWNYFNHHREFFDWIGEQLAIDNVNDWYDIRAHVIAKLGGTTLLNKFFGGSHRNALKAVYSDTEWQHWKFVDLPLWFWEDRSNHRAFLMWLEEDMEITSPTDWYGVTVGQLLGYRNGKSFLFHHRYSINEMLKTYYPFVKWDSDRIGKLNLSRKSQYFLIHTLKRFLPREIEVVCEAYTPIPSKHSQSAHAIVFDIWIPQLNLAIERQGEQHYVHSQFIHGEEGLIHQYSRDMDKCNLCSFAVISLLQFPFWWSFTAQQMASTISQFCPQLEVTRKIDPPQAYFYPISRIKYFKLSNEESFAITKPYMWTTAHFPSTNVSYLDSEDMRMVTDGKGNFYMESGKQIELEGFLRDILTCGFEIEFYLRYGDNIKDNTEVSVTILDAPKLHGDVIERVELAKHLINWSPRVQFVEYWKVHDVQEVLLWQRRTINERCKLTLKGTNCNYMHGRHPTMQQVKTRFVESATVVSHHNHKNYVQVKLQSDGSTVWVQSRMNRTKQLACFSVGDKVDIVYFDRTIAGGPKNATICAEAPK